MNEKLEAKLAWEKLCKQANTNPAYTRDVVLSTDNSFRIAAKSAVDDRYADCVSIEISHEGDPQMGWSYAHFSPARARLFAHMLIERADALEAKNGVEIIDTESLQDQAHRLRVAVDEKRRKLGLLK
jgi:hypothetical protein